MQAKSDESAATVTEHDPGRNRHCRELARRLMLARKLRGMTLDAASELAGCSASTLSALEGGDRDAYLWTVTGVCDALGIQVGWLVAGLPDVPEAALRRAWSR